MLPDSLLDDDETIEIESASWTDANLVLRLKQLSNGSQWLVSCIGAAGWCIQDRITEGLRISEDDPVLWPSQFAVYTTYFSGKPNDPYRVVCDLLSAVPRTAGVFALSAIRLAELLATGSGSLGSLPHPAIRVCQQILRRHGMDLYHLGSDESETTVVHTALLFGSGSFVIAEQFRAEPLN